MTSQAPERTYPEPSDRDERRIRAFARSVAVLDTMDLETDTLRALFDFDPITEERTEEPTAAARPD